MFDCFVFNLCFTFCLYCSAPFDVADETCEIVDSPSSSMDLEKGAMSDILMYGTTPPNPRQRKLHKVRDRSLKIKGAKRESSLTKYKPNRSKPYVTVNEVDKEGQRMEPEPPPSDGKRRSTTKNFTTSRNYERDYKHSSSDLVALENVAQSSASSLHQIHVDSPNRFLSLNSKPVVIDNQQKTSLLEVQRTQTGPDHEVYAVCPKDRYDFYTIFSRLISLHLKPKAEKESKASPLSRQMSADQELWQNQWSDLIWLELQAWHNNRTMQQQDEYLYRTRETVPSIFQQIMHFKCPNRSGGLSSDTLSVSYNGSKQPSTSSVASDGQDDSDIHLQFSLDVSPVADKSPDCEQDNMMTPVCSTSLYQAINDQQNALMQVTALLNRLDFVHDLYPSMKAVGRGHKQYNSDAFHARTREGRALVRSHWFLPRSIWWQFLPNRRAVPEPRQELARADVKATPRWTR